MTLNVIRQRNIWWSLSSVIILSSIISMVFSCHQLGSPLRLSIDLAGGTRLQFERDCTQPGNCNQPIDIKAVREAVTSEGLGSNSSIQIVGSNGVLIRTKKLDFDQRSKLQNSLTEKIGAFDPQEIRIDTIGPTLRQQFFTSGVVALIVSFIGIAVYLSFRFQLDYAVFAIIALFHDILITIGIFSILGWRLGTEVDSLFLVALLMITGFSANNTVVIYNRIRETISLNPHCHIQNIVNDAVNQTLVRSINTTLAMLLTLFAIFLFGGETLKNFVLALIIGFTVGTYSSIFITSTLIVLWKESIYQPIPAGPVEKKFKAFN